MRESELKEEFADGVNNKCDGSEDWYDLKSKLLDVAGEVCGYTKGKPSHSETWWWNKDVDVAVRRKRELFRIWRQSRNEEDRKKYCDAKKDAKRVVYMAMDQKAREAVEKVDSSRDGRELFRIAKQRAGEKSDAVGISCLKDKSGAVKVSVDDRKKIWKEHMEKLMNVENEWSDSIDASKVEGAVRRIEVEEVRCAMNRMKIGKASGPSGVALEMFKAGGDKCLKSLTNIFNDILFKNKLPEEWMLSSLVPIFKGKGDPLNPNSYRGIKLLEHAFKLYEKILDGRLREVVDIDKMQYGFMPGRRTVDAVFVLRRLTEKFRAKNKKLFFVFVDLEKAFDRVPREVIRFALRRKDVPEYLVNGVMSLYEGCKTAVLVHGELSSSFSVKVGVHQESVLSPLLFIMVMDALTEDVRDGSLMELLYADGLVLCGESLNDVMDKYKRWKNAVEGKGLRVNVDKTKGMQLSFGKKSRVSKVDPCGVCGERVGCNSIQCTKCQRWVHRRCSDVPRQVSLLSCWDIFVEHVLVIIVQ